MTQVASNFSSSRTARFNITDLGPGVVRLIVALVMIGLWELGGWTIFDRSFISPPSLIIRAIPSLFSNPGVVQAIFATFYQLVVAFISAAIIGIVIGTIIGLNQKVRRMTMPLVLLVYAIPQMTILPLFVLYLGIGAETKIAFGISHGIFPIILNVIAGVQTIEKAHFTLSESLGASYSQILRRIVLPHMMPSLFTGLRLGISATLLGVILAELYVSTGGIGHYTEMYANSFDAPSMFALVTILALMAVLINELARRIERRFSFWQQTR